MPTSYNINNSAMPNNTQDSLRESEIEADGSTPPILFKRKFDDNVDASLRITTSTSKSRKK